MEFKEAMRIWKRMCKTKIVCNDCEMRGNCVVEKDAMEIDAFEAEAILAKWEKEHPKKAIADDFFEKHPKAMREDDGIPPVCAKKLGYVDGCLFGRSGASDCKSCWRRPLEEVEG